MSLRREGMRLVLSDLDEPGKTRIYFFTRQPASAARLPFLLIFLPIPSRFNCSYSLYALLARENLAPQPTGSTSECPCQCRAQMRSAAFLFACATGLALVAPRLSGDDDPSQYDPAAATTRQDEIELLKAQVRLQQEQIDELRKRLDAQQNLLQRMHPAGAVAPAPVPASSPTQHPAGPALRGSAPVTAPLSFELGGATITPTGFVDFSQVWRSKAVTSGVPTNFAAIPFNNTVLGHRRQTVSSAANSRLGMQINPRVLGFDVLGLVETDFQGYVPNNVATTSNSYGLRLRLAFADLRKNRWEFLAGQNWSLITPARKGIDPLPDTLFLTQDLDPNIQSGLVWARNPQFRVVFHASRSIANGRVFRGWGHLRRGSAGAGTITLPSALAPNYFGQVDNSTGNGNSVPTPNVDWIAKITFDPEVASRSIHVEFAGLMNRFAFFNPLNNLGFTITGGAVAFNAGVEAVRHLSFFTNNFYTNGAGSFIFGEAPDLIIQGTGAPSLLPAASTVDGVEYDASSGHTTEEHGLAGSRPSILWPCKQ